MVGRLVVVGAVALSLVALAACGGDDGGGAPEEVVNDLAAAVVDGDTEAICALFTAEALDEEGGCEELAAVDEEDMANAGNIASVTVVEETDTAPRWTSSWRVKRTSREQLHAREGG